MSNFCPMGSTWVLFRMENTKHWPHIATFTGEHFSRATLSSTACYVSPTSTPSAFCQPGFLSAIFRSAKTSVDPRAAQLDTGTHSLMPAVRRETMLLALICMQSCAQQRARSPPLPAAAWFSASLVLGLIRHSSETILSRRITSKSFT